MSTFIGNQICVFERQAVNTVLSRNTSTSSSCLDWGLIQTGRPLRSSGTFSWVAAQVWMAGVTLFWIKALGIWATHITPNTNKQQHIDFPLRCEAERSRKEKKGFSFSQLPHRIPCKWVLRNAKGALLDSLQCLGALPPLLWWLNAAAFSFNKDKAIWHFFLST